ncbi:MAG: hypothetical protein M3Z32_12495 [Acidobacteriota bacterium]|nr:hypothetical protein [Acidobacteriota bacterium]
MLKQFPHAFPRFLVPKLPFGNALLFETLFHDRPDACAAATVFTSRIMRISSPARIAEWLLDQLTDTHRGSFLKNSPMLACLAMMAPRLVEVHRILKETGASICIAIRRRDSCLKLTPVADGIVCWK